jgi:hypothetical protein
MSPQQSKMSVETRTPTAWGEARTFFEFDWAGDPAAGGRPESGSNNLGARMRYAYGTLGPLLFGQANSNFNDSDAGTESLNFGGLIGGGGPARIPQIRWTEALAPYGVLGALSVSAEAPETDMWAPTAGIFGTSPTGTAVNATSTTTNCVTVNAAGVQSNQPCTITTALANPLKAPAPAIVAAWYIPQPWGHVDFATVVRPTLQVSTPGLNRTFVGWGGSFSGDVKPNWFGWTGDFFTWNLVAGEGMGGYLYAGSAGVGPSTISLVSNFTDARLRSGSVLVKPARGYSGNIGYRHNWTPELRSNIGVGFWHVDIPGLRGAVCPAASRATAGGGCNLNKELTEGEVNLIWSPVSFIDFGLEYVYGRRLVLSGQHGDEHVIHNRMRVRF